MGHQTEMNTERWAQLGVKPKGREGQKNLEQHGQVVDIADAQSDKWHGGHSVKGTNTFNKGKERPPNL